jgi:hypothetical protein
MAEIEALVQRIEVDVGNAVSSLDRIQQAEERTAAAMDRLAAAMTRVAGPSDNVSESVGMIGRAMDETSSRTDKAIARLVLFGDKAKAAAAASLDLVRAMSSAGGGELYANLVASRNMVEGMGRAGTGQTLGGLIPGGTTGATPGQVAKMMELLGVGPGTAGATAGQLGVLAGGGSGAAVAGGTVAGKAFQKDYVEGVQKMVYEDAARFADQRAGGILAGIGAYGGAPKGIQPAEGAMGRAMSLMHTRGATALEYFNARGRRQAPGFLKGSARHRPRPGQAGRGRGQGQVQKRRCRRPARRGGTKP